MYNARLDEGMLVLQRKVNKKDRWHFLVRNSAPLIDLFFRVILTKQNNKPIENE